MINVLYIHGMGGGGDSRIPSILREVFVNDQSNLPINIVCRTYDFDPDIAHAQILSWVEELRPQLIIGESLGALHAIRIVGIPHILVSPALNAPLYFDLLSWLTHIPGVTALFDRLYRPKDGDRQKLHFTSAVLKKYRLHRSAALSNSPSSGGKDWFYSFFGLHDHYMRSGIVCIKTWKKYFGDTYATYDGTHFMEDEYVVTLLVKCVYNILNISI